MRELTDEAYERCGCSLRTIHGIPCACVIRKFLKAKQGLNLTDLHPYWTTLILGDGVNNPILYLRYYMILSTS